MFDTGIQDDKEESESNPATGVSDNIIQLYRRSQDKETPTISIGAGIGGQWGQLPPQKYKCGGIAPTLFCIPYHTKVSVNSPK